jgi:hypothetical protein
VQTGASAVPVEDRSSATAGTELRHARAVAFSWWMWSALLLVALGGLALFARSVVVTVRTYGFGRGRMDRGPGAPSFWGALAVFAVDGASLLIWVHLLDH